MSIDERIKKLNLLSSGGHPLENLLSQGDYASVAQILTDDFIFLIGSVRCLIGIPQMKFAVFGRALVDHVPAFLGFISPKSSLESSVGRATGKANHLIIRRKTVRMGMKS